MLTGHSKAPWDHVCDSLKLLHENDGEFFIERPVFDNAIKIARKLAALDMPMPKIWNHGPKSVVFDWGGFRLTISRSSIVGDVNQ